MSEKITAEDLLNNIVGTLSESSSRQKAGSFFGEESSKSVSSQFNRLFGRQKPVHHILGGGRCRIILFHCMQLALCLQLEVVASTKSPFIYSSHFMLKLCSC